MEEKDCLNNKNYFNKTKEFNSKLKEIIHDLKVACSTLDMPMFVAVAVENTEETTRYECDMVYAGAGTSLKDNRISKLLLAINDFDVEHPEYVKRAIRDLEDYLDKLSLKDATRTSVELKKDYIPDMLRIVKGGAIATYKPNDDDDAIWED